MLANCCSLRQTTNCPATRWHSTPSMHSPSSSPLRVILNPPSKGEPSRELNTEAIRQKHGSAMLELHVTKKTISSHPVGVFWRSHRSQKPCKRRMICPINDCSKFDLRVRITEPTSDTVLCNSTNSMTCTVFPYSLIVIVKRGSKVAKTLQPCCCRAIL